MNRHTTLIMLAVLFATGIGAQTSEYETILLPVATKPFAGAFGSVWQTEFVVYNDSSRDLDPNDPLDIFPLWSGCGFPGCPPVEKLRAREAQRPRLFLRDQGPPGLLLHVKRSFVSDLSFNLRVQDLSRQSLTWGTEIPVVREAELRTTRIVLMNVPLDSRFRQALRVYDPDSRTTSTVSVRIYPMIGAASPLVATTLLLQRPSSNDCSVIQEKCFPSYAEIQNLPVAFPNLQGQETVRVEIESLTPGLRFWSFIAITNNETQHVTTITPQ